MATDSNMKYCQNCGQQLSETASYCDECGEPTGFDAATSSETSAGQTSERDSGQRRKQKETETATPSHENRNQINSIKNLTNWSIARILTLVGGVLSIVSAFLPWYTTNVLGITNTVTGIDGGAGIEILFFGAGASVVTAWRWGRWQRVVLSVIGGFLLLSSFLYISSPLDWLEDPAPIVQENPALIETGIGLYLTVVGGVLVAGGGIYDTIFGKSASDSLDGNQSQTAANNSATTTDGSGLDPLADDEYYKCVACGQPFQKENSAEEHAERKEHTKFEIRE